MFESFIAPLLLGVGGMFCVTGALGLFRFPELLTRMHAGAISDTLGAACIILGLVLLSETVIAAIKLILIFLFLMLTGPTAIHALAKTSITSPRPSPQQGGSPSKPS